MMRSTASRSRSAAPASLSVAARAQPCAKPWHACFCDGSTSAERTSLSASASAAATPRVATASAGVATRRSTSEARRASSPREARQAGGERDRRRCRQSHGAGGLAWGAFRDVLRELARLRLTAERDEVPPEMRRAREALDARDVPALREARLHAREVLVALGDREDDGHVGGRQRGALLRSHVPSVSRLVQLGGQTRLARTIGSLAWIRMSVSRRLARSAASSGSAMRSCSSSGSLARS